MRWRVYTLDYDSLLGLGELAAGQLRLELVDELEVKPGAADRFYWFLNQHLFGNQPARATLEEIRRRFGYGSDIFQGAILKMRAAFREIREGSEMRIAFAQWQRFLSIAYGRFEASEVNFLIHSYLSALAKLLAYQVISGAAWLDDDLIHSVLNGSAFRRLNVANFTENDFYSWTARPNNNLAAAFRMMADELSRLDFSNIDEDILKGVYQELVDDDTRHALGEHYTPDWLCAQIVAEMQPRPGQKILDPSCGSGSFLKAAANYLIAQNPDISAGELNASLYGIDVHPLSVQIAKATLLIAYGKRLEAEPEPLSLNIFLANSLLLPEEEVTLLGESYCIAIDETRVNVPAAIFGDKALFTRMVSAAETLAERDYAANNTREPAQIKTTFQLRLGPDMANKGIIDAAANIYKALLGAKKAHRNGIWAYILVNTFAPVFRKNQFDLILGNPPWLAFRDIVANDYQKMVMKLARTTGVAPKSDTLFTQLELAAVFLGHCLDYFLQPKGRLAFVMPRSIFTADQHHKIREGKVQYMRLKSLWDLAKVEPLFNVPACVLFCEKGKRSEKKAQETRAKVFAGAISRRNASPEEAAAKLDIAETAIYFTTLNKRSAWNTSMSDVFSPSFYLDKFKAGATLFPRCLCFVDIDQPISGPWRNRILQVKSADAIYREAKEPWKGIKIKGTIHTKYLFETALANNLVPFGLNGSFLIALPVWNADGKTLEMRASAEIEEAGDFESAEFFEKAEQKWLANRTERMAARDVSYQDRLDWQRGLVTQDIQKRYLVLYTTSGTNAVAAIIDREGAALPFIANAVTYLYATSSHTEALYLCAFLNSPLPNKLMKPFQASGLFGARHVCKKILEIPLPEYDASNTVHQELAALAQAASEKASAFLAAQNFDRQGGNLGSRLLGRFRNEVRAQTRPELEEIDRRIARLCDGENSG